MLFRSHAAPRARSGAELSRQIARVRPALLILIDHAENSLFEVRQELEEARHFRSVVAVLADCKDATRMREVFLQYRPSAVFHAAAYKHVPLMEENPVEAVRNNAVATRIVAAAAGDAGAQRFVLEMGEPVKIIDLARNMIRLSGHEPDVDIAIDIVGSRPGEKIHEDLFNPDERARVTPAEKIVVAERHPLEPDWVTEAFQRVEDCVYEGDAAGLAAIVSELAAERAIAAEQRARTT